MEEDSDKCKICSERCLFCSEVVKIEDDDLSKSAAAGKKFLMMGYGCEENSDLKSQVSVFFMLSKVLGLSTEFLDSLLVNCGNPSEWKIKLCRLCSRLFKEAEHLWDRMMQLQRDYDKVTYEIKDSIVNSISPDEVSILKEDNGVTTKKAGVLDKLKKGNVTEGIRETFLIDLCEQNDGSVQQGSQIPELSTATWRKYNAELQNGLNSNSNMMGVPSLSLAGLETKVEEIVQMACISAKNSRKRQKKPTKTSTSTSSLNVPEPMTNCSDGNEKQDSMSPPPHISQQNSSPDAKSHIIAGVLSNESESTVPSTSTVEAASPAASSTSCPIESNDNADDERSLIRIVKPYLLMEPEEENDNTKTEEVSHVAGVIKPDGKEEDSIEIIELDDEEDKNMEDALPVNKDTNDPLFPNCPDINDKIKSNTSTNTNVAQSNNEAIKPEKKLKSRFLKIRPVRKTGNIFECTKCLSPFETRLGCQKHIFRDHYNEVHVFQCHLCHEKFSFYQPLRQHVSETHGESLTAYEDNFNPKKFFGAKDGSKSNKGDVAAKCPLLECSLPFKSKRALSDHTSDVHGSTLSKLVNQIEEMRNPPGLDCHICSKRNISYRAINIDILDIHMRKMHNIEGRSDMRLQEKIVPSVKKASFKKPSPKSRNMKCPDCSKLLPNRDALAEHLKNPEIKCQLCTKHFMSDEERNLHLENEHNNFRCRFCQKLFFAQIVYEKHMEHHHQSKEYDIHVCPICQLRVTEYSTMQRHISHTHSGFPLAQSIHTTPLTLE